MKKLLLREIFSIFADFPVIKLRQVMTIDHSSLLAHDSLGKSTTFLAKMQILNVQVYFHYLENLLSVKFIALYENFWRTRNGNAKILQEGQTAKVFFAIE